MVAGGETTARGLSSRDARFALTTFRPAEGGKEMGPREASGL